METFPSIWNRFHFGWNRFHSVVWVSRRYVKGLGKNRGCMEAPIRGCGWLRFAKGSGNQMSNGSDATGEGLPRIGVKEVAERAGVGVGSASRVLSGKGSVSPEMVRRVKEVAASLGYKPNLLAQSLRSRSTRTIGFVISDITNPLLSSMVSGAEDVLSRAGYSLLLTNSGGRPEIDAQRVRLLFQRQVDGLIALPASEDDPATVAALGGATVPIILIDRSMPAVPNALRVLSDHHAGMSEATRFLLAQGHTAIALLVGPAMRPAQERARAFEDVHRSVSRVPFAIVYGDLSARRGYEATAVLLDREPRPSAIILGGNQLLEGALDACRERSIAHGTDVALVCCDDTSLGRLSNPPIPTILRDTRGMGRVAAELLLAKLKSGMRADRILPTWFESRDDSILNVARSTSAR